MQHQKRVSFAEFQTQTIAPDLLAIQLESFTEFLQIEIPANKRELKGLEGVFRSVFPIESTDGNIVIEYVHYDVGELKYPEEEAFNKNLTYSSPIKVIFRLIDRKTGEIKEKDIYIGDFPIMTDRGTFIINGAERVVVSQIYKSPGVLFSAKNKEFAAKIVPEKGSWLEFIVDSKKDLMYVRIDSRRKLLITTLLLSLGMTVEDIVQRFFEMTEVTLTSDSDAISKLVGQYVGETVLDEEGNPIVSAMDKLFPNSVNQLSQKGVASIKIIKAESLQKNRALVNTLEKDDTKDNIQKAVKKIYSILHPGEAAPFDVYVFQQQILRFRRSGTL